VIDSQSVKTTEAGGPKGYDAGKKVMGRKRHAMVDTMAALSNCSFTRPTCRIVMARCRSSGSLGGDIPLSRGPSPTVPTTARASLTPLPSPSRSSANSPTRPASRSIRDGGSSSEPSPGSIETAGWPRTLNAPSAPPPHSSTPPRRSSSSDASLVTHEIQNGLLETALPIRPTASKSRCAPRLHLAQSGWRTTSCVTTARSVSPITR